MVSQQFLPSQDSGSGLEVFCWTLRMQLTDIGRGRMWRTFQVGFYGPGIEVEHIVPTIFYWQELSNFKASWEM